MSSPINSQIAKRYAQALFQAGSSADRELLAEEFKNVLSVLADPSVHETFHHPRTSKSHKSELIRLMRLSPLLESFLLLIVEKSREQFLVAIEAQFQQLVLAEQKKTIADVTSAIPLEAETLQQLEQKLAALTGKTVLLQTNVDPSIGGGMVIKVDGKVIDASLNQRLKQLQTSLQN